MTKKKNNNNPVISKSVLLLTPETHFPTFIDFAQFRISSKVLYESPPRIASFSMKPR